MKILYSDQELIVCVKSVGIDAEHQLPELLREKFHGEIFTVHRLDLNVGGVMVYARTKTAAAVLSRAIQEGTMKKEYIALVHGIPPVIGDWEDLLWKDRKKNKVFVVSRQRNGVKRARLEYRRLEIRSNEGENVSLVRIQLHTGRSHQIRVQFASRQYPLVGDHKYGSHDRTIMPMLFSCCISFSYRGKQLEFVAMPEWAENS